MPTDTQELNSTQRFNLTMKENALKAQTYGGKRFLGWNTNGTEVWISFVLDRKTLDLTINTTAKLSSLLSENAVLADARVEVERGKQNRHDVEDLLKFNRRNQGGEVRESTIKYLIKIVNAIESKSNKFFTDGKINKSGFRFVSNSIFSGSLNEETGFRWTDVMEYWDLPSGPYFTLDSLATILED